MTRAFAAVVVVVTWSLAGDGVVSQAQDQPVFRGTADAVLVDVAVSRGKGPVRGLSSADFELRDNQVVQQIASVSIDEMPIDLSLLIDVSASVSDDALTRMLDGTTQIAKGLRSGDAIQIALAGDRVARVPFEEIPAAVRGRRARLADGGSALYDGLTALLMQPTRAGRRQVILALTDAVDTSSVIAESAVRETARRSDASVYIIALFDAAHARAFGFVYPAAGVFPTTFDQTVAGLVEASGGRFLPLSVEQPFVPACLAILDELRSRYTLSFVPQGVSPAGWHELTVRVRSAGHDVRARRGYWRSDRAPQR